MKHQACIGSFLGLMLVQEETLSLLINGTPTGVDRNDLCDANIHMKAAQEKIHAVLARSIQQMMNEDAGKVAKQDGGHRGCC